MTGKKGLDYGSRQWSFDRLRIAKSFACSGAELAFTYQGEALEKRVQPLAQETGSTLIVPCDVSDRSSIDATFKAIEINGAKLVSWFMPSRFPIKPNWMACIWICQFPENHGYFCLFVYGCVQTCCAVDERRWIIDLNLMVRNAWCLITMWGVAKAALEASVRYQPRFG